MQSERFSAISWQEQVLCVCFVDCCLFVLFLLAFVLSVILQFRDSDYPFGIFKLFLYFDDVCFVIDQQNSWIFIVLANWNNSQWEDMLLHSETLSWILANQSLLLLFNAAYLVEKKQLPSFFYSRWFDPTDYCTWCKYSNQLNHRCGSWLYILNKYITTYWCFLHLLWFKNKNKCPLD